MISWKFIKTIDFLVGITYYIIREKGNNSLLSIKSHGKDD